MTRLLPLLLAGLGLLGTVRAGPAKNVLFVTIDDLRDEISCYGKEHVKTPALDRLARRGLVFDRAYVQAAFCNPSRASFLTGLRPDRTGILDNRTRLLDRLPDVITLPRLFRDAGYHTVRLGKIFHGGPEMDDTRAWDEARFPRATARGHQGEGRNLTGGRMKWCRWLAAEGDDDDQPDGQIARLAVEFLQKDTEKPFFLAVGFHKPHDPFVAPKRYFDLYPLDDIDLYSPGRIEGAPQLPGGGWLNEFAKFTDRERREFLRSYLAATSFVDAQLGRVLDALERSPHADDTIIFVLSDHGYHLGERGWWNKNTLFELTARTPLLVATPDLEVRGKRCSRLVEFVDIYPTLAELCGLKSPEGLDGKSFVPLLSDPGRPWKEAAFTQLVRGPLEGRSVRTERWRLTEWDDGKAGIELYDHASDPQEQVNLADREDRAETVRKLRKFLRRLEPGR